MEKQIKTIHQILPLVMNWRAAVSVLTPRSQKHCRAVSNNLEDCPWKLWLCRLSEAHGTPESALRGASRISLHTDSRRQSFDGDTVLPGCYTPEDAASDSKEELFLPAGLTMEKLLEIGEEVFAKRQTSLADAAPRDESTSMEDILGMASRIAGLVSPS